MTGGGLEAWPQVWVGAGQGVGGASDDLATGTDLLCRRLAAVGDAWGDDDLGLTFFNGAGKTPGFGTARDQALSDLKDAVNILRGTGAGLIVSGRNYAAAEQASTVAASPPSAVQDAAPLPYELPTVTTSLVESDPPPAEWLQILGLLETLVGGCEWPRGNIEQIQAMRDAFSDMAGTIDGVQQTLVRQTQAVIGSNAGLAAEEYASFASLLHGGAGGKGMMQQLAAECRGLAGFCDTLARQEGAARLQFGWSVVFLIWSYAVMQVLAAVTAGTSMAAFLSAAETEAAGLRAFLLDCGKQVLIGAWYGGGMDAVGQLSRMHEGLQTGLNVGELAKATGTGAVAGGLMGAANGLVSVGAGRFSSLAGLSKLLAAPGMTGHLARIGFGGVTGTLANGAAEAMFNDGQVDWKKAAESGLGMAVLGDAWQSGKDRLTGSADRAAPAELPNGDGLSYSPTYTDDSANGGVVHVITKMPEPGAGDVHEPATETSAIDAPVQPGQGGLTGHAVHGDVHEPPVQGSPAAIDTVGQIDSAGHADSAAPVADAPPVHGGAADTSRVATSPGDASRVDESAVGTPSRIGDLLNRHPTDSSVQSHAEPPSSGRLVGHDGSEQGAVPDGQIVHDNGSAATAVPGHEQPAPPVGQDGSAAVGHRGEPSHDGPAVGRESGPPNAVHDGATHAAQPAGAMAEAPAGTTHHGVTTQDGVAPAAETASRGHAIDGPGANRIDALLHGSVTGPEHTAAIQHEAQQIVHRYGADMQVDFTGMDAPLARGVTDGMRALARQDPARFGELNYALAVDFNDFFPGDGLGHEGYGEVDSYAIISGDGKGILLNTRSFDDSARFMADGVRQEADGYTVPGGGTPKGVFDHEVGHFDAADVREHPALRDAVNRVVSDHLGMPYDVEAGHDLVQRTAIEERLSVIGGENPDQMIAEAMTECRNAPEPRSLAAGIGDVLANRDAIRQAYEDLNGPVPRRGAEATAPGHERPAAENAPVEIHARPRPPSADDGHGSEPGNGPRDDSPRMSLGEKIAVRIKNLKTEASEYIGHDPETRRIVKDSLDALATKKNRPVGEPGETHRMPSSDRSSGSSGNDAGVWSGMYDSVGERDHYLDLMDDANLLAELRDAAESPEEKAEAAQELDTFIRQNGLASDRALWHKFKGAAETNDWLAYRDDKDVSTGIGHVANSLRNGFGKSSEYLSGLGLPEGTGSATPGRPGAPGANNGPTEPGVYQERDGVWWRKTGDEWRPASVTGMTDRRPDEPPGPGIWDKGPDGKWRRAGLPADLRPTHRTGREGAPPKPSPTSPPNTPAVPSDPNLFRLSEPEAATLVRAQHKYPDLDLKASTEERDGEYTDKFGRTYDQMGDPRASKYWNPKSAQKFYSAVDAHLRKSMDYTLIDLTGFSDSSRSDIANYVNSLPEASQVKIKRIGF